MSLLAPSLVAQIQRLVTMISSRAVMMALVYSLDAWIAQHVTMMHSRVALMSLAYSQPAVTRQHVIMMSLRCAQIIRCASFLHVRMTMLATSISKRHVLTIAFAHSPVAQIQRLAILM